MPDTTETTPALVLMPAAPKRRANKTDITMMIAELEYQRRKEKADRLQKERDKLLQALLDEGRKELQKRLDGGMKAADFGADTFCRNAYVRLDAIIPDTPKMKSLRKRWNEILVHHPYREDVLKEVRSKMEQHRTDHIKLALAEDPALRKGVEELRKQLFND